MSAVTMQLNRGVAKVPFHQHVRHWLFVGRSALVISPRDPRKPDLRVAVSFEDGEFDLDAQDMTCLPRLVFQEDGVIVNRIFVDEVTRVGSVRIVPRALLRYDGRLQAVQLELQAINPRELVRRAQQVAA